MIYYDCFIVIVILLSVANARIVVSSSSSSSWGVVPTENSRNDNKLDAELSTYLHQPSFDPLLRMIVGKVHKTLISAAARQQQQEGGFLRLTTMNPTIKNITRNGQRWIENLPKNKDLLMKFQQRTASRIESFMKSSSIPERFVQHLQQELLVDYPLRLSEQIRNRRKTLSNILFQKNDKYSSATRRRITTNNMLTTEIADLANGFEQALIAFSNNNNNAKEIHVGKLLLASERLESTMRRIGLTQSANAMAGNIEKIRNVYDKLPESSRDSMSALLEHEHSKSFANNQNKIPDQSATCGLLWLGRSLQYQNDLFRYMLQHNDCTLYEAASVAYEANMKEHLSWPLQKLCQAAMATTLRKKERRQMFCQIGGFRQDAYGECEDEATKQDLQHTMDSLQPMLCRWQQVFDEYELGTL